MFVSMANSYKMMEIDNDVVDHLFSFVLRSTVYNKYNNNIDK